MNILDLPGCTPEPLMAYLKALGVFRLVAEQADPSAAISWHRDVCRLHSSLDREALVAFFLERYRPTPILGPWGGRSGFYPGSSESSARAALDRIVVAAEDLDRLTPFRDAILAIRSLLSVHGFTEKVREDNKLTLMRSCRNELPEDLIPWLDAVFVLTNDSRKFPPLLGTGGNEGSGSYVSTFAQLVVSLLIERGGDAGVAQAIFGDAGAPLQGVMVGHFHPGAIGGPNSSQGFDGGGGANPWEYLLAIEGTLVLAGAAARRLGIDTATRASYPFCVEPVAVGYASESDTEAANGSRAELWLPLWWKRSINYAELRYLYAEGRAQLSRRQARNAVDFALAVNLLGVDRGIDSFVRYAFVKRNGDNHFATPLGRVSVTPRPNARLLDDPPLTRWLDGLRNACRNKDRTPGRYQAALRRIDQAMFDFANRSEIAPREDDAHALIEVLRALGRAERTLAVGSGFREKIRPLQGLAPDWLVQANDESAEFRLAASLAGMRRKGQVGPFRVFLEPVELTGSSVRWLKDRNQAAVWSNRPLAANLAAVFLRRQLEAFREGLPGTPLDSKRWATLPDVLDFLLGRIDDDKLHDLIWGLSTINWDRKVEAGSPSDDSSAAPIPFAFGVARLLVEPWTINAKELTTSHGKHRLRWRLTPVRPSKAVAPISASGSEADGPPHANDPRQDPHARPDPAVFHLLASGQADAVPRAVDRAARRLRAGGRPVLGHRNNRRGGQTLDVRSSVPADRLLAAMLFPLSWRDLGRLANAVLYPPQTEEAP